MRRPVALIGTLALVFSLVTAVGTLALPPSTAAADPVAPTYRPLAGMGATATDPVMSALSKVATINGQPTFGSYAADGSTFVTVKDHANHPSCTLSRPTSEASALTALVISNGGDYCVDFARMTHPDPSTPTSPAVDYIPFAADGLSFAVSADSHLPTNIAKSDLQKIYRCDPSMAGITGGLPAAGSEQRLMWLAYLQIANSDVVAGNYPCIKDTDSSGSPRRDNVGINLDADTVIPFSAASYLAQSSATQPDLTARAVLGRVTDGPAPIVANTDQYPEGVTFVVNAAAGQLPSRLSLQDLKSAYTCTITGVTPLLPPSGSVRTAFEGLLGIQDSDVVAGAYPCIHTTVNGVAVPENDARTLDGTSIVPFSISSYLDQTSGVKPDVRGGQHLGVIDQTGAANQASLPLILNPSYGAPLSNFVYNAVRDETVNNSPVNETFIGPNSLLCQHPLLLADFGFRALTAADTETCGSIQHSTVAPTSISTPGSIRAAVALDGSGAIGSGTQVSARQAGCTMTGSYTNRPNGGAGDQSLTAHVTGAHCTVSISADFFDASITHALLPFQQVKRDVSGGGDVQLYFNKPGYYLASVHGVALAEGDVLAQAQFTVADDSLGIDGAQFTLLGPPVPGVNNLIVRNQSPNGGIVNVTWSDSATSYVVQRADPASSYAFHTLATVSDAGSAGAPQFDDTAVLNETTYQYRVIPVDGSGVWGNPSYTVATTPALPARIKHYVALGDSYAAGTGASARIAHDATCHRSLFDYAGQIKDVLDIKSIRVYASTMDARLEIFACNGAVTGNIVPGLSGSQRQPHMDAWDSSVAMGVSDGTNQAVAPDYQVNMLAAVAAKAPVDLVTLSIGGNDAGFSSVVHDCAYGANGCTSGSSLTSYEAGIAARINALSSRLTVVYDAVRANSGQAKVQVVGYPHIFPTAGATNCASVPLVALQTNLDGPKMAMLNRLTDDLDSVIAAAVTADNEKLGATIEFNDTRSTFGGHDACAGGAAWIVQINPTLTTTYPFVTSDSSSLHPNDAGWTAEAGFLDTQFFGTGS